MSQDFDAYPAQYTPASAANSADIQGIKALEDALHSTKNKEQNNRKSQGEDEEIFSNNAAFDHLKKTFLSSRIYLTSEVLSTIWQYLLETPSREYVVNLRGPRPIGSFEKASTLYQWGTQAGKLSSPPGNCLRKTL